MVRGTIIFLLLLAGCGSDTVSNSVSREQDRQRESAATLYEDFKQVAGTYATAPEDLSPWNIEIALEVLQVQKDGYMVPQPVLGGTVSKIAKSATKNQNTKSEKQDGNTEVQDQPLPEPPPSKPVTYQVSNGTFDKGSSQFAARISGVNSDGINISCKYNGSDTLNCKWRPASSGTVLFNCILRKK